MRTATLPVAVLLAGLCLRAVGAQQRPSPPVFRTAVDLVRVDALVTEGGRPVRGLSASDFEILDNGVPQRVTLATTAGNVAIALVLDTSGSVKGEKLRDLIRASQALVGMLRTDDEASLVTFSDRLSLQAGPVRDSAVVAKALVGASASGRTAMWDALFTGVSMVARDTGRALVLLFTDGFENCSWLTQDQVMQSLSRSDVVVYVVKTRPAAERQTRAVLSTAGRAAGELQARAALQKADGALQMIASQSGGSVFEAASAGRLRDQFVGVLNEFRARYLLTYVATGVRRDDGWHALAVRLKNGKGKVVQARPGYYALPSR